MGQELIQYGLRIKEEADEILYQKGLMAIVKDYGIPHITGSYALELMTWRDLDIYLESPAITEADFFMLGRKIENALSPVKMSYRNEKIGKTEGLPCGLYWGIYMGNERKGAWKIDIWAMDAKECRQRLQFCDDLAARLTPGNRKKIMEIKSKCWTDPEYRRSYTSLDIYSAVLDKEIGNIEEFRIYISKKS
jgi:hypothetical protein